MVAGFQVLEGRRSRRAKALSSGAASTALCPAAMRCVGRGETWCCGEKFWDTKFYGMIIIIIIMGYIFATMISQNKSDKTKGHVSRWYRHINNHNDSTVFSKYLFVNDFSQLFHQKFFHIEFN